MEITKEKLIECGFEPHEFEHRFELKIRNHTISVDFFSNSIHICINEWIFTSYTNDFNRLNSLVYGITGEWLEEKVLMPSKLTAENGAKYALNGEFKEEFDFIDEESGNQSEGVVYVSWHNIKEIYRKAVNHFNK